MSGAGTAPVVTRSRAVWRGEKEFDAGPDGRTHTVDAASRTAPGPVETMLNAIATCFGIDVVDILAKRRTPVSAFRVEIAGTRRPEVPRRLVHLALDIHVDGERIEAEHAERAISLAFEKYCSVAGSLAPDIEVDSRLILNGEARAPRRLAIWTPGTS